MSSPTSSSQKLPTSTLSNEVNRQIQQLQRRVKNRIAEGSLSKAASELTSPGIHLPTPEVLKKLHALHPQMPLPSRTVIDTITLLSTDIPVLQRGFGTLKILPSRLCCRTLRSSPAGDGEFLLQVLTEFVTQASNGALPEELAPLLLVARLLPFKKKGDAEVGVRPVAVGETIRRLIAKTVLSRALPSIRATLPPLQCGVGVSNAVPYVVHAMRNFQLPYNCQSGFGPG